MTLQSDEQYMRCALEQAEKAFQVGEVPVGAILVADEQIIGRGFNCPIASRDMTAHAEIQALREAARECGNYRLPNSTLYVTIEPCTMCVGAMIHARVERLVFGAPEPKAGVVVSQEKALEKQFWNHRIAVCGSVLENECSSIMQRFFAQRRAAKKDIRKNAEAS